MAIGQFKLSDEQHKGTAEHSNRMLDTADKLAVKYYVIYNC